jgi:AraC-like DNA-binding protein
MNPDTLSEVLRGVRLRSAVFFNMSGGSEWAAEAPSGHDLAPLIMGGVDHVIEYHVIIQGSCWATIPGQPPVELHAGDAVLFPHGDAHVMSSAPGMRGLPDDLGWVGLPPASLPVRITYRGAQFDLGVSSPPDVKTRVVCGFLGCDRRPFNPLIDALPRLLHLQADADSDWLAGFTQLAVAESRAARPGSEAMLARMSETMFVAAVRRYADQLPPDASGWLSGLRDRFVGRVLGLMHENPAHGWTLDELGQRVGLGRSTLHERFVQLMGVPPMQYLTQWRMQSAARLLCETRSTVASIALEVGYDSEAAFARAFKRTVGLPPAAWRREREASAEPA